MLTPEQIKTMTLEALREARDKLDSTEWALEMDAASAQVRRQSGLLLGQVQGEILRLENLQLAEITDSLAANGARLTAAAGDVKREVKRIARVAKILKVIDQLLAVAVKVAPKALGLMGAAPRLAGARAGTARPAAKRTAARKTAPKRKIAKKKVAKKKTAARRKVAKKTSGRKPAAKRKAAAGTRTARTGARRRASAAKSRVKTGPSRRAR